jgi:hypothetical protein
VLSESQPDLSDDRLTEKYADTGQIGVLSGYRGDIQDARPKVFHVTSGVL